MATRGRARRIGVTMRETHPQSYREPRDALARVWGAFLAYALPEAAWMPVPNLGLGVRDYAERWGLDGLILSGGEDPGRCPVRDRSERELLRWALAGHRPVLGVCRGFQLMQQHFGGRLARIDGGAHIARPHPVQLLPGAGPLGKRIRRLTVNSYHGLGIRQRALAAPLQALALTADGYVEAAISPGFLGLMWHPERHRPARAFDRALVRWAFGYGDE